MTESVFGPTIVVEGDVAGGDLVVHGTIRGAIADASAVTIAKGARVEATIAARSVFVAGAVEGVITARERIELTADAVMTGDVRAPRILIADGARFRGNVDMDAPRAPASSVDAVDDDSPADVGLADVGLAGAERATHAPGLAGGALEEEGSR